MDDNNLQIINLYRHNIVYVTKVKKNILKSYSFVLAFMLICAVAFSISFIQGEYYKALQTTINYIYNPVNPLYNDLGHIIFTSNSKYNEYNIEKDVTTIVPIISSKLKAEQDHIAFEVAESVMVMAAADGVVETVDTTADGTRYLEVKHSKSITTRYENVDIAGVVPGDIVKQGQDIATAKTGETVKFYVLKSGKALTNLTINKNKVEWQS